MERYGVLPSAPLHTDGMDVTIPSVSATDADEFLAAAPGNHELHHPRNQPTRHSRTLRGMSRAPQPG
jgi:hypothetical protein